MNDGGNNVIPMPGSRAPRQNDEPEMSFRVPEYAVKTDLPKWCADIISELTNEFRDKYPEDLDEDFFEQNPDESAYIVQCLQHIRMYDEEPNLVNFIELQALLDRDNNDSISVVLKRSDINPFEIPGIFKTIYDLFWLEKDTISGAKKLLEKLNSFKSREDARKTNMKLRSGDRVFRFRGELRAMIGVLESNNPDGQIINPPEGYFT
jgi:hypothetical protein